MNTRTATLLIAASAAALLLLARRRQARAAAAARTSPAPASSDTPTHATLNNTAADPVFPLQYGSQGPEVKTIQTILRDLHILDENGNDLQPDAIWGPHTEHAAAKLPRYAYYSNTPAAALRLASPWHRPFQDATRTVSGRTTIPKAGYQTIVAFYNRHRTPSGTDLGHTQIVTL
ncbi:MAG: hypothetical protein IJU81_02530 [Bacteroidales bacterium]|nr:hypothetical protein [Bacteroidales bacterium]